MGLKTNMVFLCSKYRGDTEENTKKARKYAKKIADWGYSVIAPHLLYPQFLDDSHPADRLRGIKLGVEQMKFCDQVWVFGNEISTGMSFELAEAQGLGIPVKLFDADGIPIDPDTLEIDERVNDTYRLFVKGLNLIS